MSPNTDQILRAALSLSSTEQVELIEALIAALGEVDPQPLDDVWLAEIRRRSAEYDAGKAAPISWSVVRELSAGPPRPLNENMDDIGRRAEAQELTPELLDAMLRDE